MAEERVQRRLAAILAADVVGYSRMMEADEEGMLAQMKKLRADVIDPKIAEYGGRIFKTTGDGILAEFPSAVDAVRHAVAVQRSMAQINVDVPDEKRITYRIGVSLGDVMVDGDDLFGNGVNVAARMESLADAGGICISGNVQEHIGNSLDISLEDLGEQTVKNINRPVRCYRVQPQYVGLTDMPAPPLPDKPSIAVLPFENMSPDPEQEYFSDGMSEDIITELSKISGLFVIARHSAFTYKGRAVTLKQVGRELGVRYILEGSVRKAGSRLRITAQLIDSVTDHHLWADRYDRNIEDIFAVQDEVARKVTDALAVVLEPGEREKLAHVPTKNIDAYELFLRARTRAWPPTPNNILSARRTYSRVIEADPRFAGGYAGKSLTYSTAVIFHFSDQRQADSKEAMALAQKAVEVDPDFARSHSALGLAYSANGQSAEAIDSARRAVELQPGDADSHAWLARCLMYAGDGEAACEEAQTAIRLDPQYVDGPYHNLLALASFVAGRYADTIEAFEINDARGGPHQPIRFVVWAAACAHLDRLEEAARWLRELSRTHPNLTIEQAMHIPGMMGEQQYGCLIDGLRKAGLPEK